MLGLRSDFEARLADLERKYAELLRQIQTLQAQAGQTSQDLSQARITPNGN